MMRSRYNPNEGFSLASSPNFRSEITNSDCDIDTNGKGDNGNLTIHVLDGLDGLDR